MPNHRRALDPEHPLGSFAVRLRQLQAGALSRAQGTDEARHLTPDKIAEESEWKTSRTAIYAALNGTRLASTDTLCALVTTWDARGRRAIPEWLAARDEVEQQLIRHRPLPDKRPSSRSPARETTPEVQRFAMSLRELHQRSRLTMHKISQRTHYSPATISRALSGKVLPTWEVIDAYAAALDLSQDERRLLAQQHRQAEASRRAPHDR